MHNPFKGILSRAVAQGKSKQSAILALTDQGIISLCNFLTILVLTRALPVETFGFFILVHTALLLLTGLQHASLTQAHNVLAAHLEGSYSRDFNSAVIILQLSFSFIGVCLLVGSAFIFRYLQMDEFAIGLSALSVVLVPWLMRDLLRRVLYTQLRVKANLLTSTVSYGLQLAAIVMLVQYKAELEIQTIFVILGASSSVAVGIGLILLRHTFSFQEISMISFRQRVSEIWRFSGWLAGGQLLAWLGKHGHSWLIATVLGIGPLGSFSAALQLCNVLNPLDLTCSAYLPPKASKVYADGGHDSLTHWLRSRAFVVGSLYLSIVIAIILFARPLLDLMYAGKYSSTEIVFVLSLAVVSRAIRFGYMFFSVTLIVIKKTYALFIENVISLVFVLSIGLVLIQSHGIVGATIAKVILSSLLAVYGYFMVSYSRPAQKSAVLTLTNGKSK